MDSKNRTFRNRVEKAFDSLVAGEISLEQLESELKKIKGANGEYVFTFIMTAYGPSGLAKHLRESNSKFHPEYVTTNGKVVLCSWLLNERCACGECDQDLDFVTLRVNEFVCVTTVVTEHNKYIEEREAA